MLAGLGEVSLVVFFLALDKALLAVLFNLQTLFQVRLFLKDANDFVSLAVLGCLGLGVKAVDLGLFAAVLFVQSLVFASKRFIPAKQVLDLLELVLVLFTTFL